nr:integrase, catalytic region, zinc finger, CCHC-type, peptidase aspartic, catalytic [Tanacetum cinerariifolium]
MIRDRSRLKNFVKKFIGTVRFGNDHFGAIMGYGDYVIGDSVIFRVYYMEGLDTICFLSAQYRTRSYIFDAWTDKFRARTKFGSCSTLCTPTNKELDILFQHMFDEYLEPLRVERPVSPAPVVPVLVNSASTLSSTSIDQDAPSPSHSPSSSVLQSLCLHQGVAAESPLMDVNPFAPVDNDPFINIFAREPTFEALIRLFWSPFF